MKKIYTIFDLNSVDWFDDFGVFDSLDILIQNLEESDLHICSNQF